MSVVYVREQGATVRKTGEQLRVTQKGHQLFDLPLANLEQLVLMGNVQITTPAAALLMKHGVDVVFMGFYGEHRGRMFKFGSKFAQLRHQQLRVCDDVQRSLAIAQAIVIGKINNQRVVLMRRGENVDRVQRAVSGMQSMLRQVETARDLDQLRGYEGKAAAYYFEGIRSLIAPEWEFQQRAYYPPPDAFNALLSFTYTLLLKDVFAQIQLVGLDPYLGFFHALGYNRPGLALDLMEEFRPAVADLVVLNLVRQEFITLHDFERTNLPELPIRMTREAMERVVAAYEERLAETAYHPLAGGQTNYRRVIELQVRQIAHAVNGEADVYEPLLLR